MSLVHLKVRRQATRGETEVAAGTTVAGTTVTEILTEAHVNVASHGINPDRQAVLPAVRTTQEMTLTHTRATTRLRAS